MRKSTNLNGGELSGKFSNFPLFSVKSGKFPPGDESLFFGFTKGKVRALARAGSDFAFFTVYLAKKRKVFLGTFHQTLNVESHIPWKVPPHPGYLMSLSPLQATL